MTLTRLRMTWTAQKKPLSGWRSGLHKSFRSQRLSVTKVGQPVVREWQPGYDVLVRPIMALLRPRMWPKTCDSEKSVPRAATAHCGQTYPQNVDYSISDRSNPCHGRQKSGKASDQSPVLILSILCSQQHDDCQHATSTCCCSYSPVCPIIFRWRE